MEGSGEPAVEAPVWSRRHVTVVALFLVAVAVQVGVPTVVMTSEPNRDADEYLYRYGWQMFTSSEMNVDYVVTDQMGRRRAVSPVREVGSLWGNVHYGTGTLRRLCETRPAATKVTRRVATRAGDETHARTFACR